MGRPPKHKIRKRILESYSGEKGNAVLRLACGHSIPYKKDPAKLNQMEPVQCPECVATLERCEAEAGWFTSRMVGSSIKVLDILVNEGALSRSSTTRAAGIRFRVVKPK